MERKRSGFFRWALLCLVASSALAQTPAPLTAPNVPVGLAGSVLAIARQPDGGLILGGRFTMVDGVPRRNLARLTPAGTLDMDWNPSADDEVAALAVGASGEVYAGGSFSTVDGQPRNLVAKLSGKGRGAVDAEWNPGFVDTEYSVGVKVSSLSLDANGALFVGGDFHLIGGQVRNYIAKLSANGRGAVDATWNASLSAPVKALAIDSNGDVYAAFAGVDFWALLVGKYSGKGTGASMSDWKPSITGTAKSLVIGPDGALYATGRFIISRDDQRAVIRFPRGGGGAITTGWNLHVGAAALAFDGAGSLYVGYTDGDAGGIAKVSTTGETANVDWRVETDRPVQALGLTVGSQLYAGGAFEAAGGRFVVSLARLATADGKVTATVGVEAPGEVTAIARQPNGGTIVGGRFLMAGAFARRNLMRIAPDGALDREWNPSFDRPVQALAVDPDNQVYVAGQLPYGVLGQRLARFAGTGAGATDPRWSPTVGGGPVYALAADAHGNVYASGGYSQIADVMRSGLARLSALDATPDPFWIPEGGISGKAMAIDSAGAIHVGTEIRSDSGTAYAVSKFAAGAVTASREWSVSVPGPPAVLALAADGSLYAGVDSWGYPTASRQILKVTHAGKVAASWSELADDNAILGEMRALAVGTDQTVHIGGSRFLGDSTPPRNFLVKLSGDLGTVLADWNPGPDGSTINALLPGADNSILVGGDFATIGGEPRGSLAALPSSTTVPRRLRPPPIPVRPLRAQHPSQP